MLGILSHKDLVVAAAAGRNAFPLKALTISRSVSVIETVIGQTGPIYLSDRHAQLLRRACRLMIRFLYNTYAR
ncbi:MAG TPA: hypothetical protein VF669_13685 [Tepidisphaeraceae bacterium]|jgi:hypothetical protein